MGLGGRKYASEIEFQLKILEVFILSQNSIHLYYCANSIKSPLFLAGISRTLTVKVLEKPHVNWHRIMCNVIRHGPPLPVLLLAEMLYFNIIALLE